MAYCYIGNIMDYIGKLPTAQAIINSPPYYCVRKYPIGDTIWGGDPNCEHEFAETSAPPRLRKADEGFYGGKVVKGLKFDALPSFTCTKCGAWRGQLGQEPTPTMFVNHLADIYTALRDSGALATDGVLFVNIKDTYASGKGMSGRASEETGAKRLAAGETMSAAHSNIGGKGEMSPLDNRAMLRAEGIKPKSKAMIPERLALAMQERGWLYRQEIIWRKTNPLPESVTDRLPVSHEKILMFTPSAKYYFNRNGVKVPCAKSSIKRYEYGMSGETKYRRHDDLRQTISKRREAGEDAGDWWGDDERSLRDVWDMSTANHKSDVGDHIAPMPFELAWRCVMLATKPGDIVMDPFAGTGKTAAAAYIEGRDYCVVDMDERLPDFVAETIAKHKGKAAPLLA